MTDNKIVYFQSPRITVEDPQVSVTLLYISFRY